MGLRVRVKLALLFLLCAVGTGWAHAAPSQSINGPLQVQSIQFEGVRSFAPSQLKEILRTKEKRFRWFTQAPLDRQVLDEDLAGLAKFYQSQGFYHARVLSHQVIPVVGNDVRIVVKIDEGEPMKVSQIDLRVDGKTTGPWNKKLLAVLPLQPGCRFTSPGYEDIEKTLLRYLADRGYPKAHLDLKARLHKKNNLATISVDVAPGPVCYFGPIQLEGNESVADEVILRELTFVSGKRFNASELQSSQRRLFDLDLFQFVDITAENLEGKGTDLPIRILVKEAKKQTVRVGAGYGTEDQLRGLVQWEVRNFLGDGRRLQVNAKASFLVQLIESTFLQPYFLGPKDSLAVSAGAEHEDQESYENRRFFLSPLYNYKLDQDINAYFAYNLEANRLLDVDLEKIALSPLDKENQEYYISSLIAGGVWERVDDPLNPREGFRFFQRLEWSSIALGSEVDFIKLTLEGRGYVPLREYGVLAARLEWGGIHKLENTQDIPIFKRFFAGGSDSVRGYPYQLLGPLDENGNPIGGMTALEGSLEYRFPVPVRKAVEGVFFFDFGNVFEESYEVNWGDLRYTAGCGLRYLTLVGPLRLDFGYQLNPPEQDYFNPYEIYFSIGHAF